LYKPTVKHREQAHAIDGKEVMFLDSPGINISSELDDSLMNTSTSFEKFLEKKSREMEKPFISEILKESDISILVVEEMTEFEKSIMKMMMKIPNKKIVVVHNYQNLFSQTLIDKKNKS